LRASESRGGRHHRRRRFLHAGFLRSPHARRKRPQLHQMCAAGHI